jgi:signal transduction histidine kinase
MTVETRSGPQPFGGALAPVAESSPALREAAEAFRRLDGADAAWLAVRESRSRSVVVRCVAGADAASAVGLRIAPGIGVGGSVITAGGPCHYASLDEGAGELAPDEQRFLTGAGIRVVMVVPLRSEALWSQDLRLEGLAYIGRRDGRPFSEANLGQAVALGDRLARPVRDAQRIEDGVKHWARVAADTADAAPDHRLDAIAHAIAEDVRVTMRSVIAIVFRLDGASGALHALGVDGAVLPVIKRGQVLPPGSGSAGEALMRRATFVADNYASGMVRVPPIMSEAVPNLPPFTTLSTPLIVDDEVIGALTVSRQVPVPYDELEKRLIEALAAVAAPVLARAQRQSDDVRRQQGATELSRLAGSLTQSLSLAAVAERLVQAVISLVHGTDAAFWDARGRLTTQGTGSAALLREPSDARLRRAIDLVRSTGHGFWTPDLTNDPRIAQTDASLADDPSDSHAVLAIPVRTSESFLGVLVVAGETGRAFTEADEELAQALADQAALAMANAMAYHELEISKAEVLRHEKLVAVGRLAAGLAHELRNPLQNAVGFIAELRDRAGTEALTARPEFGEFPPFLKQAHAELRRAANIVDRLLDYVRERRPTLETVDLRTIVSDAAGLVAPQATREGRRITITPAAIPLPVRADPVMLRQVVVNVLTNALDALDGPGPVQVDMGITTHDTGSGRVELTIRDTGRGIAPEDLPKVFDPFFTTKEIGKGVGLGLAVCRAIIEQHKGTIAIASTGPGRGATVVVELPVER